MVQLVELRTDWQERQNLKNKNRWFTKHSQNWYFQEGNWKFDFDYHFINYHIYQFDVLGLVTWVRVRVLCTYQLLGILNIVASSIIVVFPYVEPNARMLPFDSLIKCYFPFFVFSFQYLFIAAFWDSYRDTRHSTTLSIDILTAPRQTIPCNLSSTPSNRFNLVFRESCSIDILTIFFTIIFDVLF